MNFIQAYKLKKEIKKETKHQSFLVRIINLYILMDNPEKRKSAIAELTEYLEESRSRVDSMKITLNTNSYIKPKKNQL